MVVAPHHHNTFIDRSVNCYRRKFISCSVYLYFILSHDESCKKFGNYTDTLCCSYSFIFYFSNKTIADSLCFAGVHWNVQPLFKWQDCVGVDETLRRIRFYYFKNTLNNCLFSFSFPDCLSIKIVQKR